MMRKATPLLLLTTLLAAGGVYAAPESWSPLLTPQALATMLEGDARPQILRVSGDHHAGHIPGSVSADYSDFRGPANNPGALPPLQALTATVQSLGLEGTRPVVLVHDGASPSDMGSATRIYWTLKSLGLQDLAILNGGFRAWQQAALPVSTDAVTVTTTDWTPRWRNDWRISTEEIERRLDDPGVRLVDARPPAFFDGSRSSIARPGTIEGAASLSFESWFDGARMKHPDALRQILVASPLPDAAQTVSFCNSGHWSSINWFVLSELAGVPETRMYAESMAEWSRADRPMDNQPSRVAHYWAMTVEWFNEL
ncbi:MAG: sulfurtransferase [Chromatocurvus sp.]